MVHISEDVDRIPRSMRVFARDLSDQHLGMAYEDLGTIIFISNIYSIDDIVVIDGFDFLFGVPRTYSKSTSGKSLVKMLPDLRLAAFTPYYADRDDVDIVESVSVSLPMGIYKMSNSRQDKRGGWKLDSFDGRQIELSHD